MCEAVGSQIIVKKKSLVDKGWRPVTDWWLRILLLFNVAFVD